MKSAKINMYGNLQIEFIAMTIDDIEAIMDLENRCFIDPWSENTYRRDLNSNPHSFYWTLRLANASHMNHPSILAYGGYWIMGDEAHIVTIATDPDWQRQRLGEWLLLNMLAEMRTYGVAQATLEVRASNQAAVRLYLKLGFIEVGTRPNYYRDPTEDALLLTLFGLDDGAIWQPLRLKMEQSSYF